jgi:hypothetical protein
MGRRGTQINSDYDLEKEKTNEKAASRMRIRNADFGIREPEIPNEK